MPDIRDELRYSMMETPRTRWPVRGWESGLEPDTSGTGPTRRKPIQAIANEYVRTMSDGSFPALQIPAPSPMDPMDMELSHFNSPRLNQPGVAPFGAAALPLIDELTGVSRMKKGQPNDPEGRHKLWSRTIGRPAMAEYPNVSGEMSERVKADRGVNAPQSVMGARAQADRTLNSMGGGSGKHRDAYLKQQSQEDQQRLRQQAGTLRQSNDANDARINQIRQLTQGLDAKSAAMRQREREAQAYSKAGTPVSKRSDWAAQNNADIRRAEYRTNRGRAPGQQVDARWLLGGLSVGGQRPEETGGDPLEQVQQLVSQNRPMSGMNRDQLRARQIALKGGLTPEMGMSSGINPNAYGKYAGRGKVRGMESLATVPNTGYRDQQTGIALHGPSSQYHMNQMGLGADEQAAIRKAAADQKAAAYANTIRMKEKIRANRQLSALNNARQMAGSLDPRRQFQSQMILDRQLRESDAGPGGDPMQRYIDKVSRMGLHPKDAAALIQQQQNFLNQLELERQRQYGNIEAGKASGAIDPKYVNPFGSPVASSGRPADLPGDTGPAPAGAAPAPAAAPQYRSFRDRVQAEIENARREAEEAAKDAQGVSPYPGIGILPKTPKDARKARKENPYPGIGIYPG